jgi:pimeloyl-ACP methyl ester carboxylesterase
LTIACQSWGKIDGPEIIFIHGLSQSRLCWMRQLASSLTRDFRVVTYDLRGHGDSDKPADERYYAEGARWGDELAAVIDAGQLRNPTIVGWSLGGLVMCNYLARHGDGRVAALNFVDAGTKLDPTVLSEESGALGARLISPDLLERLQAMRDFLRACFANAPSPEIFEVMLAYNAMPPIQVHKAMVAVTIDGAEQALKAVRKPTVATHGRLDRLFRIAVSDYTARTVPGASLSIFDGCGHAPFFENAARFNAELASLAARS